MQDRWIKKNAEDENKTIGYTKSAEILSSNHTDVPTFG